MLVLFLTVSFKIYIYREFPGGPVVRTPFFHGEGAGSIPGPGTKTPRTAQSGQQQQKIKYIFIFKSIYSLNSRRLLYWTLSLIYFLHIEVF